MSRETSKLKNKAHFNHGQKTIIGVTVGFMLVYFSVFFIFPIGYAFVGSFFKWEPMAGVFDFIGIANYKKLANDPLFWESLIRTLWVAFILVVARTLLGLAFATMIHTSAKFKSFFRTTYFLPVVTSGIAISLLWKFFYDPTSGLFNAILGFFGLQTQAWLRDPNLVMPCIMLMMVWKDLGYAIILYLAGLTGISKSYYEAAEVDGANRWQSFKSITVPLLRPTTVLVVITSLIAYMQIFNQIFFMTSAPGGTGGTAGGPGTSAYTIVFLLYQKAFVHYQFGEASAIAFCLFAIILVITLLQMKFLNKDMEA